MKTRLILLVLLISLSMLGLTGCGIFGGSIKYSKRDVIMRYNTSAPKDLVMFGGSFDDKKNNLVGISVPIGPGKRTCTPMVGGKTEKPVTVYAMFPCNVNNYQQLGIYNLIMPELRPSNNVDQPINMLPLMEHFYKSTIYAVDDSLDLSTVLKDIGFYSPNAPEFITFNGADAYSLLDKFKKFNALRN